MGNDIYNFDRAINGAITLITNANIHKENKEAILQFKEELLADNIGKPRTLKYMVVLRITAEKLNKPFKDCTTADIKAYVADLNSRTDLAEWTKHDYKVLLKRFYKWLLGNEEEREDKHWYPPLVKWIGCNISKKNELLPENLISREEAERMAANCDNIRNRAFILMLTDSGCRIGELLTLQLKNLAFDEIGTTIQVSGKTGTRRVRLLFYAKEIATWLEMHPDKNNREAYVWVQQNGKPLSYNGITNCIKAAAEKAGINKRIYNHLFRHSYATEQTVKGINEANLNSQMGWVAGSGMGANYFHLSGRNVDDALLKANGMKLDDKAEIKKVSVKSCPKCEANNNLLTHFCVVCGFPIDFEGVTKIDEMRSQYDRFTRDFFVELAKEIPQVKVIFNRMVKERGLEKLFMEEKQ